MNVKEFIQQNPIDIIFEGENNVWTDPIARTAMICEVLNRLRIKPGFPKELKKHLLLTELYIRYQRNKHKRALTEAEIIRYNKVHEEELLKILSYIEDTNDPSRAHIHQKTSF